MNKTISESTYTPAFLAEAVWPRSSLARDIVLIVGGSLIVALLAQISVPLPFSPVPITGQTLGVLLIGALLGSRRGGLSLLTFLGWGAMNLPVFAPHPTLPNGVARFASPTAGYLVGFVVAAFVVGWLGERGWDRRLLTAALAMFVGNIVIYLFGLPWLAYFVGGDQVLALGLYPFIPGDLIKLALAALALPSGWAWVNRIKSQ
jgi:biotin transport system substrate-specific component